MTPRRRRRRPSRDRVVDLSRYEQIVDDWTAFTAAAERPEPTVFRVSRHRADEQEVIGRLRAQGFQTEALDSQPGLHRVVDGPRPLSATFEHWLGLLYVQQASTAVAAPLLDVGPGSRVLDLCSAPGGKTTHLAELMGGGGCLVANEISEPRIRGLLGNVYRLGHPNVLVTSGDGRDAPSGALFDHILLDAPCSGEGTLRRRGGQAPNQSASFVRYVTSAQRRLLERAVELLQPGGTVLYVTCTFSPEENEAVVSDALTRLPVELIPLDLPVRHAPGVTRFGDERFDERVVGTARIYPHHLDSGGLFIAKLMKRGGVSERDESGWTPVPAAFGGRSTVDLEAGLSAVRARFGIGALEEYRWLERGGRGWMHTVSEWPTWANEEASPWRTISLGIRSVDFDSRDRPRPTNDLLRLLATSDGPRTVSLDDGAMASFLARDPLTTDIGERGPIAVAWRGDVVGRGAVTGEGLKSEVPKARAADLKRAL